jgi:hypothetical protein
MGFCRSAKTLTLPGNIVCLGRVREMQLMLRIVFVASLAGLLLACGPQKHPAARNGAAYQQSQGMAAPEQGMMGHRVRLRRICAADIQKFCASEQRPRRCLRQNLDKLSDACQTALREARQQWRERRMNRQGPANGQQGTAPQQQQQQEQPHTPPDDNDGNP